MYSERKKSKYNIKYKQSKSNQTDKERNLKKEKTKKL